MFSVVVAAVVVVHVVTGGHATSVSCAAASGSDRGAVVSILKELL